MLLGKYDKNILRNKTAISTNSSRKTGATHGQPKLDPYLLSCTEINSTWTKELNIRYIGDFETTTGNARETSSNYWNRKRCHK
jgi:hypothetical protein